MPASLLRTRAERRPGRVASRMGRLGTGSAASSFPAPKHEPESARGGRTGARLLVVDDEAPIRLLCSLNLGLAGFEVVEAENGRSALELIRSQPFDLVLLDVMLPDLGGHEVLRTLAAERPLPVAFFSARAGREEVLAGLELGAVDYITKPFDPTALAQRVGEILARVARGESDAFRQARIEALGG